MDHHNLELRWIPSTTFLVTSSLYLTLFRQYLLLQALLSFQRVLFCFLHAAWGIGPAAFVEVTRRAFCSRPCLHQPRWFSSLIISEELSSWYQSLFNWLPVFVYILQIQTMQLHSFQLIPSSKQRSSAVIFVSFYVICVSNIQLCPVF